MSKRIKRLIIICIGILIFILSPFFELVKSMAVMGVYSSIHKTESLLESENIKLKIPGGLSTPQADWYPFVMTFSADGAYRAFANEPDARLTIMYNFPAFAYTKGCSRLFDRDSAYYNGFYGAYIARDSGNDMLLQGKLDADHAANIARFDFFKLVLGDFGLTSEQEEFSFEIEELTENVPYVGYDGWTRIHTSMTVNGAAHNRKPDVMSYLQYGKPNFGEISDEFASTAMYGIIYARYFPEKDVGIYFYVMAGSEEICIACDEDILSKSVLERV